LQDPTKPGRQDFIALYLVDPTTRIISTANVPPQQGDWWASSILGPDQQSRDAAVAKLPAEIVALMGKMSQNINIGTVSEGKLPYELMDLVQEHLYEDETPMLMSIEEAHQHQLELMKERHEFEKTCEASWQQHTYRWDY